MKKLLALSCVMAAATFATADIQTFDFDDGTFQGWAFTNVAFEDLTDGTDESVTLWEVSIEDVDLGENGWNLLQGSSANGIGAEGAPQREPNFRVIPMPWGDRDCIGVECVTMFVSSPLFKLDDSGPISVDIVGGQGKGGANVDEAFDTLPVIPDDFEFLKTGSGLQGFALYDVAVGEYVEYGFPTVNNDGKEKDGRDVWETVEIPAEDLEIYAGDGKDYRVDIFDSLAGGWGWIGFDTVKIPNAEFTASTGDPADCDSSGALDAGDLACVSTIEHRDSVLTALNTVAGDLDGNGEVAFADFLVLSSNFGNADGSYSDGNIDLADGVAFADFLALSANFGATAAGAASVPEPAGMFYVWMTLLSCMGLRGSRRRR